MKITDPFESSGYPADPQEVFDPEYWQPTDHWMRLPHQKSMGKPRDYQEVHERSGIVPGIILGHTQGVRVGDGVLFNPSDPEVASTSPANFPGAVLLADVERIRSKDKHTPDLPPEPEIPGTLQLSPRAYLRQQVREQNDGALFEPGKVTIVRPQYLQFANKSYHYTRRTDILFVTLSKRGQVQARALSLGRFTLMGDEVASLPPIVDFLMYRPAIVGRSHVSDHPRGYTARRLKSLEICAAGEPAIAPEPSRVHGLLGRLAGNN
jgi:hypothetical protein